MSLRLAAPRGLLRLRPGTISGSLFLLVLACSLLAPAAATTYYVSATGNDSNNGSASAPFRQIRTALALVQPGDTVLIGDGSYLGFTLDSVSGTASQPITLQATGANADVTVTTDRSDNRDTMLITYCAYIILNGLNAFNANRSGIRIDNSPNITICNGVYGTNTTWGIFTDFSDNLLIENNQCYGSVQQHGIYVSNSCVNPTVRANICYNNYGAGIHMNADLSQGPPGLITGALVEDNVIYNNGVGGGAGINMDGVIDSVVRNNLLYNNHATGIAAFQQDGASGPTGDQIYHNTIDMASDGRWAMNITQTAGPNVVRNNILYNRSAVHGGLLYNDATDVANTDSDYNILNSVSMDDGDTTLTLAQWQAQGYEPHSFSATPAALWVNTATGDYQLLSTAPAIDTGQTLASVTEDILGVPRPLGRSSDIGSYEYPYPVVALSALALNPSGVSGDVSVQGTITLNGYAPVGGVVVALSSNSPMVTVPASMMIPEAQMQATFAVSHQPVTANTTVTITATYLSVTKKITLTLLAHKSAPPLAPPGGVRKTSPPANPLATP